MKILKITEGFVTNSSSDSAAIIIAVRKDKSLKEIMKKIGIPTHLPEDFYDFDQEDIDDYIEESDMEVDHLTDEYDIMKNYITTISWGDDDYEMPSNELSALVSMVGRLEDDGGKDCIVLYFSETSM